MKAVQSFILALVAVLPVFLIGYGLYLIYPPLTPIFVGVMIYIDTHLPTTRRK